MNKQLILVAAPPACGKTYVSEQIAKAVGHIVCLDKDDLTELVRAAFAIADQPLDMDGRFYADHIRPAEYASLMHLAFSTLRFEDRVLINAPFGKQVRDVDYMRALKEQAHACGAALLLIWVTAPLDVCYERMRQRHSDRDTLKLQDWDSYVKKINYAPPYELEQAGAVDRLMVFDNGNDEAQQRSLSAALTMILEGYHA